MRSFAQTARVLTLALALSSPTISMAEDSVSATLDQSDYALVAIFTIKAGMENEFAVAMAENVVGSRSEPGVISYRSYRKNGDNLVFVNLEHFDDEDAFNAHLETPHVKKLLSVLDPMLDKPVEIINLTALN